MATPAIPVTTSPTLPGGGVAPAWVLFLQALISASSDAALVGAIGVLLAQATRTSLGAVADNGTNVTISQRDLDLTSLYGQILLTATRDDAFGPLLQFLKKRATTPGASGDAAGSFLFSARNTANADKYVASIQTFIQDATPGAEVGQIDFRTMVAGVRAARGALIGNNWGFGGQTNPQYPVDAIGDINSSTGYRVAGSVGLTSNRTVVYSVVPVTGTAVATVGPPTTYITVVSSIIVSTTTHGFAGGVLTA